MGRYQGNQLTPWDADMDFGTTASAERMRKVASASSKAFADAGWGLGTDKFAFWRFYPLDTVSPEEFNRRGYAALEDGKYADLYLLTKCGKGGHRTHTHTHTARNGLMSVCACVVARRIAAAHAADGERAAASMFVHVDTAHARTPARARDLMTACTPLRLRQLLHQCLRRLSRALAGHVPDTKVHNVGGARPLPRRRGRRPQPSVRQGLAHADAHLGSKPLWWAGVLGEAQYTMRWPRGSRTARSRVCIVASINNGRRLT